MSIMFFLKTYFDRVNVNTLLLRFDILVTPLIESNIRRIVAVINGSLDIDVNQQDYDTLVQMCTIK